MRARIAVVGSGGGSNLQAIIDHFASLGPARSGDVVVVASNRAAAGALERARAAAIPAECFDPNVEGALVELLERYRVDMLALAGYLRLVPRDVVERYRGLIVNVHPAPLPAFGGAGMYGIRAHTAVLASGSSQSAVTIHLVDESYDRGAALSQWPVDVKPGDSPASLAERVLGVEHIVYPRILDAMAAMIVRDRQRARNQ